MDVGGGVVSAVSDALALLDTSGQLASEAAEVGCAQPATVPRPMLDFIDVSIRDRSRSNSSINTSGTSNSNSLDA